MAPPSGRSAAKKQKFVTARRRLLRMIMWRKRELVQPRRIQDDYVRLKKARPCFSATEGKGLCVMRTLQTAADIRCFFRENQTPIYYVSTTTFNLLGAEEW